MRSFVVLLLLGASARADVFAHVAAGAGYGAARGQDIFDDQSALAGPIGTLDLQVGGFIKPRLVVAGDLALVGSTVLASGGEHYSAGVARLGAALTLYVTDGLYGSAALGVSVGGVNQAGAGAGVGAHLALGYEWRVGAGWCLGVEARGFYESLTGWFIIPISSWQAYGSGVAIAASWR